MAIIASVGLVLGGLLAAAVVASTSLAQSAPGRLVQSSDGTLYVLKDGARFAVVGEPIDDEELGAFADGGTIGAAELLPAAVAAAPAVPVVTNVAPPADAPGGAKPSANSPPPPTEAASPRFMSVLGNAPGKMATVSVQAPPGASCAISYLTPARGRATAAGLDQQTVGPTGVVTWSFLIGASTQPGTGSVSVTCGSATITSPIAIEGITK
jgi:hypothetical protein